MFEHIGEKLAGMVRIPTVSGKGNEEQYRIGEYRDCLRAQFPHLFGAAKELPVGEALLLRLPGNFPGGGIPEASGPSMPHKGDEENEAMGSGTEGFRLPVLFTGHMDVVPASDSPAWEHPPFSGEIEDGCLWGRGSQDMKGPQCALLSAADQLAAEGWQPDRDIWFYLSCDEEVGGQTTEQAARLLKERGVYFETVFDEGGTICENFMGLIPGRAALFGIGEKGSLEYRFTARAAGGHAANPPADSAIVRLSRFVCQVEDSDPFRRGLGPGNREMLREIASLAGEKERYRLLLAAEEQEADYPLLHELCPEAESLLGATIAFTMISGGTAFNVMPKEAVLTANVRVSSMEGEAEVTKKLTKLAAAHDLCCQLVSGSDASPEGSREGPGYRAMEASVGEVYPGLPVVPFILGGGTDSKHFLGLTGEVLRFSPMYAAPHQGRGVHGDNESAYVRAVEDAARCYYVLLKKYL